MIPALLLGRGGSVGFPNKNIHKVLGRPMMAYPLIAAANSRFVDKIYLSTDSKEIMKIGMEHGAEIIERPAYLATSESLVDDVYKHGYQVIKERTGKEIEMMVLLFCNAPVIMKGIIDRGIEALRNNPELDSAVTVSKYNMWSPLRARKIEDGLVKPYINPEQFKGANSNRDSTGDVYYHDGSVFVVRPRCILDPGIGKPPHKWVGSKVFALKQEGALDVDYEYSVGQVEYWLRKLGFTGEKTPYDHA